MQIEVIHIRKYAYVKSICIFTGLFVTVVSLQLRDGTYRSEFGGHSDEAAHIVTGLMVHDYFLGGSWFQPMGFAENYYLHYPKVALGHWPPVFYVLQSGWTILFGASATSLLLFMAFSCAVIATMIYRVSCPLFGVALSASAALLFVLTPTVVMLDSSVMSEILVGLFTFAATLGFARYLEADKSRKYALQFAFFASLAILTKGSGILLLLVPPLCVLFTRRFECFYRSSFWLSAGAVLVVCSPFYLFSLNMQRNGMEHESFNTSFIPIAASFFCGRLVQIATVGVFFVAMIGVTHRLIVPLWRRSDIQPIFAAMAALLIGTLAFHSIVPAGMETRFLLPALPPLVFFAAAGMFWLSLRFSTLSNRRLRTIEAFMGILAVAYVTVVADPYQKDWHGFRDVVRDISQSENQTDAVIIISSDPVGEGMMITEMALSDNQRPSRYVLRASKLLSTERWSGGDYRKRFGSPAEITDYLRKIPVQILVIDTSIAPDSITDHHQQLRSMVESFPETWHLESRHDLTRQGILYPNAVEVYRSVGLAQATSVQVDINMELMLGRWITSTNQGDGREPN